MYQYQMEHLQNQHQSCGSSIGGFRANQGKQCQTSRHRWLSRGSKVDVQMWKYQRKPSQPERLSIEMCLKLRHPANLCTAIAWQGVVPQRFVRPRNGSLVLVISMGTNGSDQCKSCEQAEQHDRSKYMIPEPSENCPTSSGTWRVKGEELLQCELSDV